MYIYIYIPYHIPFPNYISNSLVKFPVLMDKLPVFSIFDGSIP